MDAKATPTNDTNYSCHMKAIKLNLTNHMGSISHRIMPLVINSLRDGHTHTNTYVYMHMTTYRPLHRSNFKSKN